jgi:hypothetical protein
MKKTFLLFSLLFCSSLWAHPNGQLQVKITNTLATDCRLKAQYIIFGHVSDHTSIPTLLPSNQTTIFKMRAWPHPKNEKNPNSISSFLLTYACDDEPEITLYATANHAPQVIQRTLYMKHMSATSSHKTSLFKRSKVNWVLSY